MSVPPSFVVAIDGPAASGKGTLAAKIAAHYGWPCLDTGLIYRAVAWKALEKGINPADISAVTAIASAIVPTDLDETKSRAPRVAEVASITSSHAPVRAQLLAMQRDFIRQAAGGGVVLDGRDIGTVVCPEAAVKLYITADVEVRAKRRQNQLIAQGIEAIYADILEDLKRRDTRDMTRQVAPLRPAKDAVVIDTTSLTENEALTKALDIIDRAWAIR